MMIIRFDIERKKILGTIDKSTKHGSKSPKHLTKSFKSYLSSVCIFTAWDGWNGSSETAWAGGRIRPEASLSAAKALVCRLKLTSTKGLHGKKRLIRRKRTFNGRPSRESFADFRVGSCSVKHIFTYLPSCPASGALVCETN